MKPIYVFGHKSPDTDSVCSAIALAYLKNQQGLNCIPKVIGPVNQGTQYILKYFNVKMPSYLNDVKLIIKDVKYAKKAYVDENESIDETFNFMRKNELTAVPIINKNKLIKGYVTLKGMAKYLISNKRDEIKTNLKHLLLSLDAKIVTNYQTEFDGIAKTVTFSSDAFIKEIPLTEDNILIVGDRYKVIEYAINSKVQLIILTRNRMIPLKLLKKAEKNHVNIITSSYSSFELCNKLSLTNYISMISETDNPLTIDVNSYYTDFINITKKYNYTNYPVVNDKKECLGVIRVTDTSNFERKKVILVDHNNYEQSIDGLQEAEILEIIDHHNLGNIGTSMPISFIARPLGCTGTIIYEEFKKNRVSIPKDIAGLLLSAIISDTLLFTSPTTTIIDKDSALELAKIAKVDISTYGLEMLKAASSIKGLSVTEFINQDFKVYNINDKKYGIGVVTTMDFEEINQDIEKYIMKMDEMASNLYESVLIFVTDVIKQGSYVLYDQKSKDLIQDAFKLNDIYEGIFIPGLISRKKQIIPVLMQKLS